jgi:two-component system LytT family response regulator
VTRAKLRVLVADDEPLARRKIVGLLQKERDVEVLAECGNGPDCVSLIREQSPDVIFLDIEMPGLDGVSVLESLGPRPPAVVFVTAYDQYALKAFEVQAVDYLLKPFDRRRFQSALERAREQVRFRSESAVGREVLGMLKEMRAMPAGRLPVRVNDRVVLVSIKSVDWVEAADNYVRLHVGEESHLLRETLQNIQLRLDPARFLRIHRSTLVNIERIKELHPLFHGDHAVILQDGTELVLSRRYRPQLEAALGRRI